MEKYDPEVTPWQVSERDFPREGSWSSTEKMKFLLRYAILAPSSHNSQPWKFRIPDSEINIFADKDRWLLFTEEELRRRIDELITRADAIQLTNRAYTKELGFWFGQGVFGTPG